MRPRWVTICVGGSGFQLTHSRGVRRVHIRRKQLRSDFNSRTHVECDISDTIPNVSGLDFNSRTHVECDANSEDQSATSFISTHALTWSATDGVVECDDYVKISTHALTWSATARRIHGAANREFQLTHSRGVRQFRHVLRTSPHTFQLTHSRGVRRAYLYPDLISIVDFNSRTHVECDIVPVFHVAQIFHFNSRTHVECDHKNPYCAISGGNFNSRTHVECDSKYCIKKRFTTQYMGIYCFLSSIILIFFIYSKK